MTAPFETLPRRIFLDSCTAQTLRDYGNYIYDAEPIEASDRIHRVSNGIANLEALRDIFAVNERAMFEWIVSRGSMEEAHAKRDPGHLQWLWDIADHSEVCLASEGPTAESEALSARLNVRAVVDADGNETGTFEVPAGGRRYRALELLVKQKRMAKMQLVPCVVREGGIAEDDSIAENDERVGLHPLDQFRAFQTLRTLGMSEEDIAARHFVSPAVVKQRLRLASVSPKLHEVYAEDGMTLEQLMAFSVTADHARQEQVWENVSKSGYDEPYQIRRMLTEDTVRASDKRAQFVGIAAYEAAGGGILRDLFERDDGGWLQDVPLLERLATEKLKAAAETIAAEGWKWIEVAVSFPYGHNDGLRQLEGTPADITADEQATIEALQAEQAKFEAEYQDADELPDEVDARLGEIERALSAFDNRPHIFDPAEIARAGAFVSIDSDGSLLTDRGFVRPEDEASVEQPDGDEDADSSDTNGANPDAPGARQTVITIGGQSEPEEEEDDGIKPLPDRLMMELFAMSQPIPRTLAETYLRNRGITALHGTGNLRFHPLCYYRPDRDMPTETWPAMIAAVTDLDGRITGAHRTWLDPHGFDPVRLGKAPIESPRRAIGHLLGNAVRFGIARDVVAAGEGIETMLSLRCVMPDMPMMAALSAAHLAAFLFPATLRRLYVVRDNDPAGDCASDRLFDRAHAARINAVALSPHGDDFNADLRRFGIDALRAAVRVQLVPEDVARFMHL